MTFVISIHDKALLRFYFLLGKLTSTSN